MEIKSPTFRKSVYDIIDTLQKYGVNKNIFEGFADKEKASIYGGESCLEISPLTNIIEDPLQLFPLIPGRGNHFTMQLAELIWVLQGKTNISEFFGQFASPAVQRFSHNTNELYAAYGFRVRNQPKGNDVFKYVINTLNEKITSRSAVIPLFSAELDTMGEEHKPCATTFQLHQCKGKLDGILTLRANDLIKGYSAINFLEFAFIQAIAAYCLGTEIGRFINFTTTMHYYSGKASERVERIIKHKNLAVPPAIIKLSDLFDDNIRLDNRYSSIIKDVDKIYTSLRADKKSKSGIELAHPIFKHIYEILRMVKFDLAIIEVVPNLPDFLLYPLLENQYRNHKNEVRLVVKQNNKLLKFKDAITWRDL